MQLHAVEPRLLGADGGGDEGILDAQNLLLINPGYIHVPR